MLCHSAEITECFIRLRGSFDDKTQHRDPGKMEAGPLLLEAQKEWGCYAGKHETLHLGSEDRGLEVDGATYP